MKKPFVFFAIQKHFFTFPRLFFLLQSVFLLHRLKSYKLATPNGLKTGVTHTPTIGVTHTYRTGLSHTCFEATGKYKMTKNLLSRFNDTPSADV